MHKITCIISTVVFLLVLFSACNSSSIPIFDSQGKKISQTRIASQQDIQKISLRNKLLSSELLSITIVQPESPIRLDMLDNSGDLLSSAFINPISETHVGQGLLEYQFRRDPETKALNLSPTTSNSSQLSVKALQIIDEFSGLELHDYKIVIPETMQFKQEISLQSAVSTEDAVIFQEIELEELFENFDTQNFIPVFEIEYFSDVLQDNNFDDHGHEVNSAHEVDKAIIDILSTEFEIIGKWELRLRPGIRKTYIYPETIVGKPTVFRITHNSVNTQLRALRLIGIERNIADPRFLEPLPIDLGELLEYSPLNWRRDDFEIFTWSVFPEVRIFDFANLQVQSNFFKRLAFFVEKEGYQGDILTNAELEELHGWNAHNYHPRDLAHFFNQVDSILLNPEEFLLRDILIEQEIIIYDGSRYTAGSGQIISLSNYAGQAKATRDLLLTHEALHGLYYNFTELQGASENLWRGLPLESREFLTNYFLYFGYAIEDEYLMVNEFQAYMLQQPLVNLPWVIQSLAADRIINWSPSLRGFIDDVRVQVSNDLSSAAMLLEDIIYNQHRFEAGDLRCLIELL